MAIERTGADGGSNDLDRADVSPELEGPPVNCAIWCPQVEAIAPGILYGNIKLGGGYDGRARPHLDSHIAVDAQAEFMKQSKYKRLVFVGYGDFSVPDNVLGQITMLTPDAVKIAVATASARARWVFGVVAGRQIPFGIDFLYAPKRVQLREDGAMRVLDLEYHAACLVPAEQLRQAMNEADEMGMEQLSAGDLRVRAGLDSGGELEKLAAIDDDPSVPRLVDGKTIWW